MSGTSVGWLTVCGCVCEHRLLVATSEAEQPTAGIFPHTRYAQDLCKILQVIWNLASYFVQDSCKFLHILAGQFYLGSVMKTFACFVPLIVSLQGNIV